MEGHLCESAPGQDGGERGDKFRNCLLIDQPADKGKGLQSGAEND